MEIRAQRRRNWSSKTYSPLLPMTVECTFARWPIPIFSSVPIPISSPSEWKVALWVCCNRESVVHDCPLPEHTAAHRCRCGWRLSAWRILSATGLHRYKRPSSQSPSPLTCSKQSICGALPSVRQTANAGKLIRARCHYRPDRLKRGQRAVQPGPELRGARPDMIFDRGDRLRRLNSC